MSVLSKLVSEDGLINTPTTANSIHFSFHSQRHGGHRKRHRHISEWMMGSIGLRFIPRMTQIMWIGSGQQQQKITIGEVTNTVDVEPTITLTVVDRERHFDVALDSKFRATLSAQ